MEERVIKVVIPTEEEIEKLKEYGIDVEPHLVKAFADELHRRLHPDEEIVMS